MAGYRKPSSGAVVWVPICCVQYFFTSILPVSLWKVFTIVYSLMELDSTTRPLE